MSKARETGISRRRAARGGAIKGSNRWRRDATDEKSVVLQGSTYQVQAPMVFSFSQFGPEGPN
jgi:hypothetical protein